MEGRNSGETLLSRISSCRETNKSPGRSEHGLVVESEGWFMLNAGDARWIRTEDSGECADWPPEIRW